MSLMGNLFLANEFQTNRNMPNGTNITCPKQNHPAGIRIIVPAQQKLLSGV
jgi:hypothetical protein